MAAMTAAIAESNGAAIDRTVGKITPAIGYASPTFAQFLAPGMIDEPVWNIQLGIQRKQ
jgi:hypothetical protein